MTSDGCRGGACDTPSPFSLKKYGAERPNIFHPLPPSPPPFPSTKGPTDVHLYLHFPFAEHLWLCATCDPCQTLKHSALL